jgi:hypothetical protein
LLRFGLSGVHNDPVSLTRKLVPAVALVVSGALALAGCSSGDGNAAPPSPSGSPSPSSTVSVPASTHLTDQGSKLAFGDSATVVFEPTKQRGTVLKLTVKQARKGSLADFKGFILDDAYKKKASYYYVDVSVQNVGDGDVGGVPIPLWGVNGDNTLLPAVNFTTSFPPCASKRLPAKFGPGQAISTCLVYLSPDKGSLDAVSYRPTQEFNPIRWTGTVAPPKVVKKHKKKH